MKALPAGLPARWALDGTGNRRAGTAYMDEFEPSFIAELVGQIYEAAADASRWDEFLTLLERFHPDSRITLFTHEDGHPSEALTVHKNYPADDLRAYRDYYVKNSPHVARASRIPV